MPADSPVKSRASLALLLLGTALTAPCTVPAWSAAAVDGVLDEVVVTGEQPGPAMWRVSRDGHSMWVMGTLAPVPAKITWRSKQAEAVIGRSGEILGNTGVRATLGVGLFAALRLIPAALRTRNNPDGATLKQAMPPDLYARYGALHQRFFGKPADAKDKSRPLFAADQLYQQALKKSGLAQQDPVWPTVAKLAHAHQVRIRERNFQVPLQDPKALIADLAQIPRDKELACLGATMDYIDRDLPNIRRRAAAWATGDLATLRALPVEVSRTDCLNVLLDAVRPQLDAQIRQVTAEVEADRAGIFSWMLLTYDTSFTAMPIDQLLAANGIVARWRAAGYTVDEPH